MADIFELFKKISGTSTQDSGKPEFIIAGLGNPGDKYTFTRHNAGFLCADFLSQKMSCPIKTLKFKALYGMTTINGHRVMLMKPQTFMNASGIAIEAAAHFYKIPPERVLVLFDDISLPVGKLRIRKNGSAGGHNGLKSIISCLGYDQFPRVKIGVGAKPHPDYDLADWVLSTVSKTEWPDYQEAMSHAGDAALCIVKNGCEKAAAEYNGKMF